MYPKQVIQPWHVCCSGLADPFTNDVFMAEQPNSTPLLPDDQPLTQFVEVQAQAVMAELLHNTGALLV